MAILEGVLHGQGFYPSMPDRSPLAGQPMRQVCFYTLNRQNDFQEGDCRHHINEQFKDSANNMAIYLM